LHGGGKALAPVYLNTVVGIAAARRGDVYSIHNLSYRGVFDGDACRSPASGASTTRSRLRAPGGT
jgi:hypothetical protein